MGWADAEDIFALDLEIIRNFDPPDLFPAQGQHDLVDLPHAAVQCSHTYSGDREFSGIVCPHDSDRIDHP